MSWVLLSSTETRTLETFSKTGQGVLSILMTTLRKMKTRDFTLN